MNIRAIHTGNDKAFAESFAAQLRESTGREVAVNEISWNGKAAFEVVFVSDLGAVEAAPIAPVTDEEAANLRRVFGDQFWSVPVYSEKQANEMSIGRMSSGRLASAWHREDGQWFVTWGVAGSAV